MSQNKYNPYLKKLPGNQRRAVEDLLAQNKPFNPAPSVRKQWLVWMLLAALNVGTTLFLIGFQNGLASRLADPASALFLTLTFLASALAAWGGISASMPGDEPGRGQKILTAVLLIALFSMPFFFFAKDNMAVVWSHNMESGWFCFRTVLLVALPSWVLLGWLVSRNASFHPAWVGAWLGLSSFLLGTGTIQLHCSHWERCHMLVNHLLPLALFIFIPIWAGSFWFSRWQKKP